MIVDLLLPQSTSDLGYGDSLALTAQLEEVSKLLEAYVRALLKAE
jgi:hypothetical protein